MSMIDIKNYRQYSSKELQEFAYKGLLECNGADLSSFLEYFCQGLISEDEAESEYSRGWDDGFDEGKADALP